MKSVTQDDSHSWVRIAYGTVKYVTDSIEDNTENPADPQEEQVSQTSTNMVAARSKAKAKPVNTIHLAPDIHEHFMIHKGYGTLRISSRTTSTILSAL